MAVSILIPVTHWGYTGGQKRAETDSRTLGGAIGNLCHRFPDLDGQIVTGDGRLHPGIEISINDRLLFPFDPDTRLKPGDQIRISSIITGG